MTADEQKQVQAAIGFYQKQHAQAVMDGANLASACEELAQKVKALEAELEELKKPETAVNPEQQPPP